MQPLGQYSKKIPLILAIIAFISVSFFGIMYLSFGMQMNEKGQMTNCVFDQHAEPCIMTLSEHIQAWQSMFTTTAPQNALAFPLLILLAVVFVAIAIIKRNLLLLFSSYATRWRLYIRHNPELSLFNSLREAFSQGILNPKTH